MRLMRWIGLGLLVIAAAGCTATGPHYTEVADKIPPIPSGKGRIYFYRYDTWAGSAVQPSIYVNHEVVGTSEAGGFFWVDQDPGDKEVSCSTETTNMLTFRLDESETKYVKTEVSMGFFVGHVTPVLESEPEAMELIQANCYTGDYFKQTEPDPEKEDTQ